MIARQKTRRACDLFTLLERAAHYRRAISPTFFADLDPAPR